MLLKTPSDQQKNQDHLTDHDGSWIDSNLETQHVKNNQETMKTKPKSKGLQIN